jgi:hypothetical protein
VFLSLGGGSILGGVCKITNSLNITDEPRLFVDVGGLNKLELAEFLSEKEKQKKKKIRYEGML